MVKGDKLEATLQQLGEKEIISRLKRFMPLGQLDDDTADIKKHTAELIINTDALVEDVHFSEKTIAGHDVGWKAVSTNLSDLICSGANEIIGITVGLIAPPKTSWKWVENVYEGMYECLQEFGGDILGGDCSKGNQKILSITAIGKLGPLRIHRAHALPGDILIASGPHGLSRLGLALLLSENFPNKTDIGEKLKEEAINAHIRPNPAQKAVNTLKKCKPKGLSWRAAGTDSSDGLLEAVQSICESSKCQAVLDMQNLPQHEDWPTGEHWRQWCLQGGEDYELILSLPKEWGEAFIAHFPTSHVIGFMQNGTSKIVWKNKLEIRNQSHSEFKHF